MERGREEGTSDGERDERFPKGDTSVTKVESATAPRGNDGQRYLAAGISMGMPLWDNEQPGTPKEPRTRAL